MIYSKQNTKILIQLTLLLLAIILVKSEKVLRFGIKTFDVWTDPTVCSLKHVIDEAIPKIDFTLKTFKDMPDVDVHIELNAVARSDNFHYLTINSTHSLCKIWEMKNQSPFAMLIFVQLKKLGHLPDNCPFKKDTYSLNGVWMDDHSAKYKLPELDIEGIVTQYLVEGDIRTKGLEVKYTAEYVYKEVAELKRHGILGVLHNVAGPAGK